MDDLTRTVKVREVGGTLCITIPVAIRRQWGLRKGMQVRIKPHYVVDKGREGREDGRLLVEIVVRKA